MTNRDFYSYDSSLHTSGHKIPIAARLSPFYHILLRLLSYIDRRKVYVSRLLSHDACSALFSADQNEERIELGAYFYSFGSSCHYLFERKNMFYDLNFFKIQSCFLAEFLSRPVLKSK